MSETRQLIAAAWQARLEGRHRDAERGLERAIELSLQDDSRINLIGALKALSNVTRGMGQLERSRSLAERALEETRKEGDPRLLAHTLRHLGEIQHQAGDLDGADRSLAEALSLHQDDPDLPALDGANALRAVALLREDQGAPNQARGLWQAARSLYQQAGVAEGVAECERHLG